MAGKGRSADALTRSSKFLSLVLRHRPESIGLVLDAQGWASVEELLRLAARQQGPKRLDRDILERLAAEGGRFELSEDGALIRAVHGHSVAVDLALTPETPPETLYHGTVARFLAAILAEGLRPQGRRHVHLSETVAAAERVGARRGKPVILEIAAAALHASGQQFFRSSSGVWLTGPVPPESLARRQA